MDTRLMQDMYLLLAQHISPESNIQLELNDPHLEETAALLHAYHIPYARKTVILGCYCLLHLAVMRHRSLYRTGRSHTSLLSRDVLDGDYLLGVYYEFAVKMNENKLISRLTLAYKKVQIALIHGSTLDQALSELQVHLVNFVKEEQKERSRTGGDTDEAA